jgi:hypothetical protein
MGDFKDLFLNFFAKWQKIATKEINKRKNH